MPAILNEATESRRLTIPTYEYICDEQPNHITIIVQAPLDQEITICGVDGNIARRRPFYLDTAVTRLPTRGPLIPARPAPRSTKDENTDTWLEMTHEEAYTQDKWARKYSRGGELADRWDEHPTGAREVQ